MSIAEDSRLDTTDEHGHRVYVHPHDVRGKWINLRKKIFFFLIMVYLVIPWVYINGKQIVLLDLPKRTFYIFGTTFYGHDAPLLVFLLLGFLFFISFVTSMWGRIWCGHACPQTVFIEMFFRPIERLVEGSGPKRDKLEKAPWGVEKIIKRSLKWFLFLLISLHITHSAIGYFVGTHNLVHISMQSPTENLSLFFLMLFCTGVILLDFGWFREQFCIIACPYGRFQSIAMDENSLIVAYDTKRGEPRRRTPGIDKDHEGDCVNCRRCVNVCPTGIDIRNGLQMECIACTMCIDACDEIMQKISKPKGLIRYTSENELNHKKSKRSPRVFIYFLLFIISAGALFNSVGKRGHVKTQFVRASKVPYQVVLKKNEQMIVNRKKL